VLFLLKIMVKNTLINRVKLFFSKLMNPKAKQREFGALKGKIRVEKDFDEPLEDFNEYN